MLMNLFQGGRRARATPQCRPMLEVLEGRWLPAVSVLTYHNDIQRTGLDANETTLTPANVNVNSFGLLFNLGVDGKVDAEPLYESNLTVAGQVHNVLFVVTEHDSAYAFDADTGALLWHDGPSGTPTTILPAGETPSDPVFGNQVVPEIGITSTPVIDPTTQTMYLVAMSKDGSGHHFQRLHALDVTTGQEKFGGPVTIQASYGSQTFDPTQYKERDALLLLNGVVYTSWASHSDHEPYTGWIIGYSASTLRQASVLDTDPGSANDEGAYWNSGAGPASDGTNFYNLSGNGTFDTTLDSNGFPANGDFGNAFLEFSPAGTLHVADYFTMHNTVSESNADTDLGSGGVIVLPDMTDSHGVTRHLAIGAGKDGNIYLVDRDNMGKFNPASDSNIYQELVGVLSGGEWATSAYFSGSVYFGPVGNHLKQFTFANALLSATPASQTTTSFGYPGTTPSISANGTSNGIVWAYENASGGQAVLHAYDATNLASELYNSTQAGPRDSFGTGNKFITPMIANGHVYASTTNSVAVFGLLATGPNANYVRALYTDFLGRSASTTEVQGWVNVLPSVGRAVVADAIITSGEGLTRVVDGFYVKLLGRAASGGEASGWVSALMRGATEEQVITAIVSGPEFASHANVLIGGTNPDANFVQALYQVLLGRTGSSSEVAAWVGALGSLGRPGVATVFLSLQEFRGDVVEQLYGPTAAPTGSVVSLFPNLMHRPTAPSVAEVNGWVNTSLSILGIEEGLAASDEFFAGS
jgi:hypothetical protein